MAPEMGSCDHSNEVFSFIEIKKLLDSFQLSADYGVLLCTSARMDKPETDTA
jgi:hypothetical protein